MSDPTQPAQPTSQDQPAASPSLASPPARPWWRRWKLVLLLLLVTPVLLFILYTAAAMSWSYSEGQRAGTLMKLSRKGWVCKTWEGELMQPTQPGVAPTIWYFTVRRAETARQITIGLGRQVVMFYREHRGLPSRCLGDTNYFVDSIRIVK